MANGGEDGEDCGVGSNRCAVGEYMYVCGCGIDYGIGTER